MRRRASRTPQIPGAPCAASGPCATPSTARHLPASRGDDLAAAVARFGAEIDHPVGELDDVEVVLDEHERVAGVDEPIEHLRELSNVVEVQAGRRLVHHVELLSGLLAREHSSRAILSRCASPPESVVAGWPSRR